MKTTFQQRLILSFFIIFILFTTGIVLFEQQHAKHYKTEALQEKLDSYANIISRYLQTDSSHTIPNRLLLLMPDNLRITLINRTGKVIFDNVFPNSMLMDNHADRPEIIEAIQNGSGTFIRTSSTNQQPYLYYVRDYGREDIIRVALPYNIQVQSFLKPSNVFLYFVLVCFFAGLCFIYYIGSRFGHSIRRLRDFSIMLSKNIEDIKIPNFPKNELGEIGTRLMLNFTRLIDSKKQTKKEREKLLLHIQTSAEGICFFYPDRTVAFYNGLFLQYFNTISATPLAVGQTILDNDNFAQAETFLNTPEHGNYFETNINRQGKEFLLRINTFDDNSFEFILIDVTEQAKTKHLKSEMTGNIAHELRTPVTSIRGFLEIVLHNDVSEEKKRDYLERAYRQTQTLSNLISEMSLLARIDELTTGDSQTALCFAHSQKQDPLSYANVNISEVIKQICSDMSAALDEKQIKINCDILETITVKGNRNLIYSIFRNLTDNAIQHAGEAVKINIRIIDKTDRMIYFSFSDNGTGIEEHHLNRIFERFYRTNSGRTRNDGGSGLGLSIVKNAVIFHGGTIIARNKNEGGLEFLFSLRA